jgi:NADH-quinone oxidoreductase subunit A
MTPTSIAAYLALFATVGFLFVLASLLLGRLLRAQEAAPGKLDTYECGEPPIGPGFVQFDLRFYVVALVFVIFDVEVAFFFPWATVLGQAARLMDPAAPAVVQTAGGAAALGPGAAAALRGLGVAEPDVPETAGGAVGAAEAIRQSAERLALAAMADISVFFGVLMLGFAYVWKKGDLDWVRASTSPAAQEARGGPGAVQFGKRALVASPQGGDR